MEDMAFYFGTPETITPYLEVSRINKIMKIFVKAKPLAKESKVEKIDDTHFVVSVKEPPRQGKANIAIARLLAAHFDVAPSCVRLVSGFAYKEKTFEIFNS